MKAKILTTFSAFIFAASCTMSPWYERPQAGVPLLEKHEDEKDITLLPWEEYFQSDDLQRILKIALENNRDLMIANLNIQSAKAAHDVARADLMPTIDANGSLTRQRAPSQFAAFTPKKIYRANLALSAFELDFFGRLQSLKKSALEAYLATQEARNVMRLTVIAETANAYADFLLDTELLELADNDLEAQSGLYDLMKLRYENGLSSKIDLLNVSTTMESSRKVRDTYIKLVQQDKNRLMTLCGSFDSKCLPSEGVTLEDLKFNEDALCKIPSTTLLSRPDIMMAEHNLKSANANIGAARAAFFPSISLTGTTGFTSNSFGNLFEGGSKTWTFTPQISVPIFEGGRNFANLKMSNTQKKIRIAEYEKAIQTAFSEAMNELTNREVMVSQMKSSEEIFKTRKDLEHISYLRYEAGINNKKDTLDAQTLLLIARHDRAITKKDYIANLINLYKVLGGGSRISEEE